MGMQEFNRIKIQSYIYVEGHGEMKKLTVRIKEELIKFTSQKNVHIKKENQ